jgi:purine-binding chemotaxis protein CheW
MNAACEIDWNEVRRRVEAFGESIDRGAVLSPEQDRDMLRTRAQRLAEEPAAAEEDGQVLELVEFELGGEHYALALHQVREVSVLREITPVPCTPPFILGIINLRGELRTVVDLKKFFSLRDSGITDLNRIIIVQQDDMQLGILADGIKGVRRIPLRDVEPALPTLTGIRAEYLRGVTAGRLVVLDAARILSDDRILISEKVLP